MEFLKSKKFNSPYFSMLFVLCAMALYYVISYVCRAVFGVFDIEHVGATEISTYLFYGFGGGVIFSCAQYFLSEKSQKQSFFAIVFIYIVMIFRDMGAQGWLTTHDTVITKIRFFTSPTNPLYEKIIAGIVMGGIVLVFLYVLFKHIKPFIQGLLKLETVSCTTAFLFVWTILTQIIDRFPAEYQKATGVALAEPIRFAMKIFEEGGESLLPLLIAIGFLQFCNLYCKKEN